MTKNVAFISVDDLINVVRFREAYGAPFQTPNIDRLLEMGTYFNGAHALVPACNPSRTATLTGLSSFRTGVESNKQDFFELVDPESTLPYLFRQAGYETAAVGKVFHTEGKSLASPEREFLLKAFDVVHPTRGRDKGGQPDIPDAIGPTKFKESELVDFKSVEWASHYVNARHGDDPWFLALGLKKPHLDWHVPEKYYDMYENSHIDLPDNSSGNLDDLSLFYKQFLRDTAHEKVLEAGVWEDAIKAYMAAVSYSDAQLGTFLDAMDRADAWKDTTLVLWSDHGYHLGDQESWGKFTHWEHGTNAPLIIVDPHVGKPGTVVQTPVSLLDIFPTLVELAGLTDTMKRDGHSLVPLLRHPHSEWNHFAGTIFEGSISLRTERYRYVVSLDGSQQLYDMVRDPDQRLNLAVEPGHAAQLRWLHQRATGELERLGGKLDLHHDTLRGGDGDNTFIVTPNVDKAIGGDGDDTYIALSPHSIVEQAGGGFDTLQIYAPSEGVRVHATIPRGIELIRLAEHAAGSLEGSARDDVIRGGLLNDRLAGHQGNDQLNGWGGDDKLEGGWGRDVLEGEDGNDVLRGEQGDDNLSGGLGRNLLRGGGGDDTLGGAKDPDVLDGGAGADVLNGQAGKDRLLGAWGADSLRGGGGSDRGSGGDGDDALFGGSGEDILFGNAGKDRLEGGKGHDVLWGGGSADTFVYGPWDGRDLIADFKPGTDRIDLSALKLDEMSDVARLRSNVGWAIAEIADKHVWIVFRGLHWSELSPDDFLI